MTPYWYLTIIQHHRFYSYVYLYLLSRRNLAPIIYNVFMYLLRIANLEELRIYLRFIHVVWINNVILLFSSIPLYKYTTISLLTHLLKDILVVFSFWSPQINIIVQVFVWMEVFQFTRVNIWAWVLSHMRGVCLTLQTTAKLIIWSTFFICLLPSIYFLRERVFKSAHLTKIVFFFKF